MGTKTWTSFVKFWKARGLTPERASKVLSANLLDKNYTPTATLSGYGFIWDDKTNRKIFKSMVDYIYYHMRKNKMKWNAALIDLWKKEDEELIKGLDNMLVPGLFKKDGTLAWTPKTFAKHIGQWRQLFFDRGWLNYDERPEIKIKRIEKTLLKAKVLKKKKKK